MVILQAGLPKSGNYWLHKILTTILDLSGIELRSFIRRQPEYEAARSRTLSFDGQADIDYLIIRPEGCFFRVDSRLSKPVTDLDGYLAQSTLVWSHSPFCERTPGVLKKFDRFVYIVRDPRDAAISLSRFAFTPFFRANRPPHTFNDPAEFLDDRLASSLEGWLQHVGGYLLHARELGFHVVFYERLLADFDLEIARLLEYLGLELDEPDRSVLRHRVDFGELRRQDPDHAQKGLAGQWQSGLTPPQKRLAVRRAGAMMKLLGYSLDGSAPSAPALPAKIDLAEWRRAMTPPIGVRIAWSLDRGRKKLRRVLLRGGDGPGQ